MNAHFGPPRDELVAFCKRWQIVEFALFGSVLRDDFGSESDIDVLVHFAPTAGWTLVHIVRMQDELSRLFGHRVDLVDRATVQASRNYIRRDSILDSAETIYAA